MWPSKLTPVENDTTKFDIPTIDGFMVKDYVSRRINGIHTEG